tara:strand:+ start:457 stop:1224 length:768 start_codon:yes stop_codon:yes gene_type:complete
MATFEAQVEGLTSLSIDGSSAPTQTELTQFLTDGAKEVINSLPPGLLPLCAAQATFTSTAAGSESETLNTGNILNVLRNDGDIDQPCRQISADDKGRVSDPKDMSYAKISDPVYYVENNKINVLPDGGSCKYSEVQYPAVAYGDSAIAVFPDEAEYLVPLYASVKALQNKMGSMSAEIPVNSDQDGSFSSSSSSSQGYEKVRNLLESQEDIELSSGTIAALSSEMQQFVAEYQWYQSQQAKLEADYEKGLQRLRG